MRVCEDPIKVRFTDKKTRIITKMQSTKIVATLLLIQGKNQQSLLQLWVGLFTASCIVNGQPNLEPGASQFYACPDETSVKFACRDTEIHSMLWISTPYISSHDPIIYVSGQIATNSRPVYRRGPFVATLTNLTRSYGDIHIADLASELTFTPSEVESGTNIICRTYRGNQPSQISTVFYQAGM